MDVSRTFEVYRRISSHWRRAASGQVSAMMNLKFGAGESSVYMSLYSFQRLAPSSVREARWAFEGVMRKVRGKSVAILLTNSSPIEGRH